MMRLAACMTCLNEAVTVRGLVAELTRLGFDPVIVVDDGSTDGTKYAGWDARAEVIRHDYPCGIAQSLMEAWQRALSFGADGLVQIDAGGSHYPTDALSVREALENGAAVVIGSRFCRNAHYYGGPWYRPILSRLAARMCNWVEGTSWTDWTSGYRGFSCLALPLLFPDPLRPYHAKMHAWQIEVLARASRWGLKIAEVPITYFAGRSSFNARAACEALGVWWRTWRKQ